ncbi:MULTISPECIES: twin-arginine translocation pathway signal [unclassified Synechococcus]|uniref:twin-arginine translocation pathway signal n=1 Tax=unclassified Synechococcus TaxID=2626047 RepID=UPI0021A58FC2|nr:MULTISPECIES: twin-arginine translocation pathway signal [unclassified Synechococcus]MCT0212875.1 twin-arginine translocation pathway signal [Synechococcus sp. CS-1326]MCT0233079.1 twin-arginine translocation pathway signal [Synechococcus sp. CS-1327]
MHPPSPLITPLSRRRLLRWGALGGLGLIAGCGSTTAARLLYSRGDLPAAWLKRLPDPWRSQAEESPAAALARLADADLLQWPDGWLQEIRPDQLQPFTPPGATGAAALFDGLAPFAEPVSRLFTEPPPADGLISRAPLAYPWAFGTWLLVLRNRRDLAERHAEGWNLLLDERLKGLVLLPSSPRVVIELALRQIGRSSRQSGGLADPRLLPQLRRLRGQARAFDDRDGLNLLLRGKAEAAVVPSQRLLPLLRSDSRLTALLPASGSPLWWNLLLRPSGSREPAPLAWIRQLGEASLQPRLLAAGWVPPLRRERLAPALAQWPEAVAALLYPEAAVLANCNSLPPLAAEERFRYQQLWDHAAPS